MATDADVFRGPSRYAKASMVLLLLPTFLIVAITVAASLNVQVPAMAMATLTNEWVDRGLRLLTAGVFIAWVRDCVACAPLLGVGTPMLGGVPISPTAS